MFRGQGQVGVIYTHKDLESSTGARGTTADGVGSNIALPALVLFATEVVDVPWPNYNGVFLLLEQHKSLLVSAWVTTKPISHSIYASELETKRGVLDD